MIQGLSARAELALALGATAGGDIAASLLRETSGLSGLDFDMAVGELMAARFFKAVPPASGQVAEASPRLDIYHDRIREVAYQGLAAERRRALHRSLGLAIEARPEGRGRDPEDLVRHFGEAGDGERRRRYAVEAAEQAAAKLAFVRAARLFRLVLDDPQPGEAPLVTAARWEWAADLFELGGLHLEAARAYQEAQRRWDEAPEHHAERPVARLRLRGLAGANLMATSQVAEGRATFEGGLALLGLPLERPLPQRLAVLGGLQVRKVVAERLADLRLPRRAGPLQATEVRFLDLMVRAFQPFWPLHAAEAALRAELLGRRIDDKRVLQRSLAFGASVPVFLGRCTPAQIERAHLRLDLADELARTHDLPLGREVVQLNRSVLWMATNAERARRTCEVALAGFAQRGMSDSFDGDVARTFYFLLLHWKGDDDDALAATARELALPHPRFINVAYALIVSCTILGRRGLSAEARDALARLRAHLTGTPASRFDLFCVALNTNILLAEGRFAEALADADRVEREGRASGAWTVGIDRSFWLEITLEASLGLLRRSRGDGGRQGWAAERDRALSWARWIAREGALDLGCAGHRGLAYLAHAEGRTRAARDALRRALMLSSSNTNPRRRWLCLETARDLGAITLDQETEAAELGAAGKFVLPVGWRP
jgi:hypothetical protein